MDQDNSKTLDQDELVAGLKQLGCEINEDKDLRIVMRHFDKEGSGRISIDEFIRAIKVELALRTRSHEYHLHVASCLLPCRSCGLT